MKHHFTAMRMADGERANLTFDTDTALFTLEGEVVPPPEGQRPCTPSAMQIRISLGHRCNFNCAYCSQCKDEDRKDILDPVVLAKAVHTYFGDTPIGNVQYWGGEPALYLNYIIKFHEVFSQLRDGRTTYGTSSNGSLLQGTGITDWLIANKINVAFSHDGPGQPRRGLDLLLVSKVRENIRRMHKTGLVSLQPTMHNRNHSLALCAAHINSAAGTENIPVVAARLLNIYSPEQMALAVPEKALAAYARQRYAEHLDGLPVPMDMSQALSRFFAGYGKIILITHDNQPLFIV